MIFFNSLLLSLDIPLADVRLLRHRDQIEKDLSPYELWRDTPERFEQYQAIQDPGNRSKMNARYWAAFVVNRRDETVFAGLYRVHYAGELSGADKDAHPFVDKDTQSCDLYRLTHDLRLQSLQGCLLIEWGAGKRTWIQRADNQNKRVIELHQQFKEPAFPGYLNLIESLSNLAKIPATWIAALKAAKGIYVLTCPRSRELYVGSASGPDGFWGRWQNYMADGHGGNLGLSKRLPSDYQVAILEVAGSNANQEDIQKMEGLWQRKLQTLSMGLNLNLAHRGEQVR